MKNKKTPKLTGQVFQIPVNHPHLQGDITLSASHPILQDLLKELGPLLVKFLPIILASLLGNDPTPTPDPTPEPTPTPTPPPASN